MNRKISCPPPRKRAAASVGKRLSSVWLNLGLLGILSGIGWVSVASYSGMNISWRSYLYPLQYRDLIVSNAKRNELDPALVAALIHRESGFKAEARSAAGALGLMQVMPSTGEWVAEHLLQRPFEQPDELLNVETNVALGTSYLSYLRDQFGEQPVAYLAAYNAGPQRVRGWMNGAATLELDQIQYPETRAYVRLILQDQKAYSEIYDLHQGQRPWTHNSEKSPE
jgi:soluble lytic murein transglycosylase